MLRRNDRTDDITPVAIDVASVMAALGRLEGRSEETLRRLDRIEAALVPRAEVAGLKKRVGRLEGHMTWGVRSVLAVLAAGAGAVMHWPW